MVQLTHLAMIRKLAVNFFMMYNEKRQSYKLYKEKFSPISAPKNFQSKQTVEIIK